MGQRRSGREGVWSELKLTKLTNDHRLSALLLAGCQPMSGAACQRGGGVIKIVGRATELMLYMER